MSPTISGGRWLCTYFQVLLPVGGFDLIPFYVTSKNHFDEAN